MRIARRRFLQTAALASAAASLARHSTAQQHATAHAHKAALPSIETGPARLSVRNFSPAADGTTKDTFALQSALDRCAALGGGEVLVPAGRYLTGALQLRSRTTLRLDPGAELVGSPDIADYPIPQVRWEGKFITGHIALLYAIDAQHIAIVGAGHISGDAALGGRPARGPTAGEPSYRHPALIEFLRCDNVHLTGFSTSYQHMWNIHPCNCRNVLIEDLTIRSNTGNGDGIDIDSCQHVRIARCDIATGDDCISLKSGRGAEAVALAEPTEDVIITGCTFSDNLFACIGIGSETSGGIRNVLVERCHFKATGRNTAAFYIKTRPGRGAFIEDITGRDLTIDSACAGFLRFNLTASGLQDENPVPGLAGIPRCRDFRFANIHVDNVPVLLDGLNVDPHKPLTGLSLENITGTCAQGITLANAHDVVLRNLHVTAQEGPLLSTANVTGTGLAQAAQIAAPPTPPDVIVKERYELR